MSYRTRSIENEGTIVVVEGLSREQETKLLRALKDRFTCKRYAIVDMYIKGDSPSSVLCWRERKGPSRSFEPVYFKSGNLEEILDSYT